jgi:dihydrofolate synthase/folylpolyglutamate synthase
MYQRDGKVAYKADLSNTHKLASYLNNPQQHFKAIHVGGTNGKGSTSHMLSSVLQEAGYKVGLYTSPHLKDFRERIKINGKMIPKKVVTSFVKKHKPFFEIHELSFFEMTVGLAFDYFAKEEVDIAVIEVGLGGRLDSTNIILPEVSVITNIGMDHTYFLGDTIVKIAREKGGIIKPNIPVVIGETAPNMSGEKSELKFVFEQIAAKNKAPIRFAEDMEIVQYDSDLKGNYQKKNIQTVTATLQVLNERGWKISDEAIVLGLLNTKLNTGINGRWQILRTDPKVICDVAHNREGLLLVVQQLKNEIYERLHIILGAVNDKDLDRVLSVFPKEAVYYFCKPNVPRGLNAKLLHDKASKYELVGEVYLSVKLAYKAALKKASSKDLIYVGGSTFVVAEVL